MRTKEKLLEESYRTGRDTELAQVEVLIDIRDLLDDIVQGRIKIEIKPIQ